jgi:hypothetical protein
MKYQWIGPDGWVVEGKRYFKGNEIEFSKPGNELFFLKCGFIVEIPAAKPPQKEKTPTIDAVPEIRIGEEPGKSIDDDGGGEL